MPKTMKDFIRGLEAKYPQEIVRVTKGPLKCHEAECHVLLYLLEQQSKWPMGVFDNVVCYSGKKWAGSTQCQADGTISKLAIACDLPEEMWSPENILKALSKRTQKRQPWTVVDREKAYVKHTVVSGKEINLFDLPIYRKDSKDAYPGWLCGVAVGKQLDTGRYNLSWHRLLVRGENRSSARIQFRHLWDYMIEYRKRGYTEMPCVWVFGHHPLFMLAGAIRQSLEWDEYEFAGGIMGESFRLTPSETWGEDFLIPADAEVVVEGYLHLHDTDYNGPWTDYMRYYSPQTLEPSFRATAFNFAAEPVFDQHMARHDLYHNIGLSLTLTKTLQERYPRVKVAYTPAPYIAVVQFEPDHPGEAMRVAHLALVAVGDFIKNVIVVDADINPFDIHDVLFSIGTRVDANTYQVEKVLGLDANRHDPSAMGQYLRVGGLIIDSTKPLDVPFPELGVPDKKMLDAINLYDYVPREKVKQLLSGLFSSVHPTRI
jgi:2,5-furandicarboxylate decarboxylase 1